MARRKIKAGSASQMVPIFIQDTSSTTGAGLGSLVFNTSGLAAKYRRAGDSSWTTITLVTATLGTYTSGGFITDGGPVTGGYEFSPPNAALAAGAAWCEIAIYGATNMLAVLIEIELDAVDYQDTVRMGLTALPNATAGANGGLPLGDANSRVDVGKTLGTAVTLDANNVLNVSTKYVGGALQTAGDIPARLPAALTSNGNMKSSVLEWISTNFSEGATGRMAAAIQQFFNIASPTSTMNLVTAVTTVATVTNQLTGAAIATAIWQDATSGDFTTSGSIGKSLFTSGNAPGAASGLAIVGSNMGTTTSTIPTTAQIATALWTDLLSGSDFSTVGSAGKLLKDNLDAAITSRMATFSYTTPPTSAAIVTAIMTDLLAGTDFNTVGSFGKLIKDYLDAAVSSRLATGSYTAPDNTSITAIKLKTDNLPASPAAVGSQMDLVNAPNATAITAIQSGLATAASLTALAAKFTGITTLAKWLSLIMGKISDATTLTEVQAQAASAGYTNITDSLEAVRDRGDVAWITGSGGGSSGAGAFAITLTVTDGTNPIQNATVAMVVNASKYQGTTDVNGQIVLSPDEGAATYQVLIVAGGYQFTPVDLIVAGTMSHTYAMTQITITPSLPTLLTGTLVALVNGVQTEGMRHVRKLIQAPASGVGYSFDRLETTVFSDSNGVVQFINNFPGARYEISREDGTVVSYLTPSTGSSFSIADCISGY